jgi:hypothetical protein
MRGERDPLDPGKQKFGLGGVPLAASATSHPFFIFQSSVLNNHFLPSSTG